MQISGRRLTWPDGVEWSIEQYFERASFVVHVDDERFGAKLEDADVLRWSDGDVWRRVGSGASEPAPDSAAEEPLGVGDAVTAQKRGGSKFFFGHVSAVDGDQAVAVRFDDGHLEPAVPVNEIRRGHGPSSMLQNRSLGPGQTTTLQTVNAPKCGGCHKTMEWSNYDLKEYDLGWSCTNEDRCHSRTGTSGPFRWFCERCRTDLCGLCHPRLRDDPAPVAAAGSAAPPASTRRAEAPRPPFKVGDKVRYCSAAGGWVLEAKARAKAKDGHDKDDSVAEGGRYNPEDGGRGGRGSAKRS